MIRRDALPWLLVFAISLVVIGLIAAIAYDNWAPLP
jgi:hypothetical protein